MPRAAAPSSWQAVVDFRPGIHENLSPSYPPGTAQESGTWGCYAMPSGALAPIPIIHLASLTPPDPILPAESQASEFRIIGLHWVGPVFLSTNATYGKDQNNTELFVAVEFHKADKRHFHVYRYKRHYKVDPVWELIWDSGPWDEEMGPVPYNPEIRPDNFVFGTSRSNHTDFTQSGSTVVAWAGAGFARMFPDDTNPAALATIPLPGDKADPNNIDDLCSPDILCMHQGRCVIFPLQVLWFGPGSAYVHNETMYWTQFNDFRIIDPLLAPNKFWNVTVGPEMPIGYGVVASLSANELFMLKRKGGALVVTADLSGVGPSSPVHRNLPFVKSTGLALNNGCLTPQGWAYPVDHGGVWLWSGGDFASNVSPQLPANFWRPEPIDRAGNPMPYGWQWTQCDTANNFTLFPNNWAWDTETNAWWRVGDGTTARVFRWAVDWRNKKAYGALSGYRNQSDPAILEFDLTMPADTFSWRSQPISTTLDKSVNIMQVGIVASGEGEVTVHVTSRQDHIGRTRTFSFTDPDYTEFLSESCGVRGSHITFTVESRAFVDNAPAPIVHEIRYEMGATVPAGHISPPA